MQLLYYITIFHINARNIFIRNGTFGCCNEIRVYEIIKLEGNAGKKAKNYSMSRYQLSRAIASPLSTQYPMAGGRISHYLASILRVMPHCFTEHQ